MPLKFFKNSEQKEGLNKNNLNSNQTPDKTNFSRTPSHSMIILQQKAGNQAVQNLLKSRKLQAKLTIGQPDDEYEREADKIADQIMQMPDAQAVSKKETPSIQRKASTDNTPDVKPEIEAGISSQQGGGQPLPDHIRNFFEPRFGHDFSQVRIHTDSKSDLLNQSLNSHAFTFNKDIFFSGHKSNLDTTKGRYLAAHELVHVIQQQGIKHSIQKNGAPELAQPVLSPYEIFVQEAVRSIDRAAVLQSLRQPGSSDEQTFEQIRSVLEVIRSTYDNAQEIISLHLSDRRELIEQLQSSYQQAVEIIYQAAGERPRVNIVLIAAMEEDTSSEDDSIVDFLENAQGYANTYLSEPASEGDNAVIVENISTLSSMLDAIESTQSERMVRRIDIFAHGRNVPENGIKFGSQWYSIDRIESEIQSRASQSGFIQNTARFDSNSIIEIHSCNLGEGLGSHGGIAHGEQFLTTIGRAIGGIRDQQVIGYQEFFNPQRFLFNLPGGGTLSNTGELEGSVEEEFNHYALNLFNSIEQSIEIRRYLTDEDEIELYEDNQLSTLSTGRKIDIMRQMYNPNEFDSEPGWRFAYMYPARSDAPSTRTFTGTSGWEDRLTTVRVNTGEIEQIEDMASLIAAIHSPAPGLIQFPPIPDIRARSRETIPLGELPIPDARLDPSELPPLRPREGSFSPPVSRRIQPKIKDKSPNDNSSNNIDHIMSDHDWDSSSFPIEKGYPVKSFDNSLQNQINSEKTGGFNLKQETLSNAQNKLGGDLSQVKVHTGKRADRLTKTIGSKGFTLGKDVFLNSFAAKNSNIIAHELHHATANDPNNIYLWPDGNLQALQNYIRGLHGTLTQPCPSSFHMDNGPAGDLDELRDRTRHLTPPTTSGSQPAANQNDILEVQRFFLHYPGNAQGFILDLAGCLRRMADATPSPLAAIGHTYPDQRGYARRFYNIFIQNLNHVGHPINDHLRLLGEGIIYSLQARQAALGQAAQTSRESTWVTFMNNYFTQAQFSHQTATGTVLIQGDTGHPRRRFILWVLGNWSNLFNGSGAMGSAANRLHWAPMRTQEFVTSTYGILYDHDQTRNRSIRDGVSYLEQLYSAYRGSFTELSINALSLHISCGAGMSLDQNARSRLQSDLPNWNTLRGSLTSTNQNRLTALITLFNSSWSRGSRPPFGNQWLGIAQISVASGGGWGVTPPDMEQP